jgi:ABC-type ATPase with predicted acetyltransferase domain
MKTIQIQLYSFDELNKDAKENAIEQIRQRRYDDSDIFRWIVDDCYLIEPTHDELIKLCGPEYEKLTTPIFKNSRKLYFDLNRNRHIDASNAIEITNDKMFFQWLEIPDYMHEIVYYQINSTNSRYPDTVISFDDNEFTDKENEILQNAKDKFSNHIETVLNRIESSYDYYFTDESIIEHIQSNEIYFQIDGSIY